MKAKLTLYICLLFLTPHCAKDLNHQPVLQSSISSNTGLKPSGLGQGFDSERFTWKSKCVTGTEKWVGQNEAINLIENNLSFLDIQDRLSGNLEVGFHKGGLSITGEASYAKASSSSDQTFTFNYLSQMRTKSLVNEAPTLTELGLAMVDSEGKVSPLTKDVCGDEYLSQMDFGASLSITVKLVFLNKSDKERIAGEAQLKLAIIEVAGAIEKIDEEVRKNAQVQITAKQIGGDITQLHSIMPVEGLFCSMTDFAACAKALKVLSFYSTANGPNETVPEFQGVIPFHTQLKDDPTLTNLNGWANLSFQTKEFRDQAFLVGNKPVILVPNTVSPVVTKAIEHARFELTNDIKNYITLDQRGSEVLRFYKVTDEKRARVTETRKKLLENITLASYVGEECAHKPEKCLEAFKFYAEEVSQIELEDLEVKPTDLKSLTEGLTGFLLYCVGGQDPDTQATVQDILKLLKETSCEKANARLAELKGYSSTTGRVNTKVLAFLPNLTYLDLNGTGIDDSDLKDLSNLVKLETAFLNKNQIRKLGFFSNWPNLSLLDLRYNPLQTTENLTGLPKLDILEVSNTELTSLGVFKNVHGGYQNRMLFIAAANNQIKNADPLNFFKQPVNLALMGNPFVGPCPKHQVHGVQSICTF